MVLKESIDKSKDLCDKTLHKIKRFICRGYKKLPKSLSLSHPFCGSDLKYHPTDELYTDLYDEWECTLDKAKKRDSTSKETVKDEDACSGNIINFSKQSPKKNKQEELISEKKPSGRSRNIRLGKNQSSLQDMNGHGGSNVLAKRMKEFEMVDTGDVEQVLDVEEALHYYSRLKSPVYLDIVDKFFLDMYSDFSSVPPAPSKSIKNSKQRHSSRRLGSIS